MERNYVYAVFIDLKKAFDSRPSLEKIGVSGKFIRLLKALYDEAAMQIKIGVALSEEIKVTSGLLQGEGLSPALFIIFISEIVAYFIDNGAKGITIGRNHEVIMLLFADNVVLLDTSWHGAQKKLRILEQYCAINGLTLNPAKS